MVDKSNRKSTPRVRSKKLTEQILGLRESLGLNQRAFAERIRVSQTQVSEWERGTEAPSVVKLIAMGNLAENPEDRMWFWQRAGLSETRLREDFSFAGANFLKTLDEGLALLAPVAARVFLGNASELQIETDGDLFLPINLFSDAASIFCMKVPVGEGIPHFFTPGDYVVIDRSVPNPDSLVDSLVAVYFEERPASIDPGEEFQRFHETVRAAKHVYEEERRRRELEDRLNREANPTAYASSEEKNEQAWDRVVKYMATSVVKFGWLRVQPAGGRWEGPWENQLARVTLEITPSLSGYTGPSIPLTEWEKGINPIQPKLGSRVEPPAYVVGRVVGWFKDCAPSRSESGQREI